MGSSSGPRGRSDGDATAQARLAASMAKRRAEQRASDRDHPERPDQELYRREIIPQVEQM